MRTSCSSEQAAMSTLTSNRDAYPRKLDLLFWLSVLSATELDQRGG